MLVSIVLRQYLQKRTSLAVEETHSLVKKNPTTTEQTQSQKSASLCVGTEGKGFSKGASFVSKIKATGRCIICQQATLLEAVENT